jgi:LmbE family N-acetylglucosaminyl deacetylase
VRPDLIVDITGTFDRRRAAIDAHASQFRRGADAKATPLNAPDFLEAVDARARVAGQRIGVRYGEAFELTAPMALTDLSAFAGRGR